MSNEGTAAEPIRVLRLFSRLNVGGPSVHVILLTEGLRSRGFLTRLVVGEESPSEGNLFDLARERGVTCERLAGLGREVRPVSDFRALVGLYRLVKSFRPAIVHTHTAKAGLLGRVAARWAKVPVVVHTYHGHVLSGYFGPLRSGVYRGLERRLAPWSSALVAVSESVKRDLVEMRVAPSEAIRVIPLGLDLAGLMEDLPRGVLRRVSGVADDAPLVGIVGRLAPIKDVTTFLRAARRVREALPAARFAIVGDGEERSLLESEAVRLGLGDFVCFHGWRRDMEAVYGDLDVVVNSSRNEGTPVALIEALAAGRPVVATRVGGNPDLLGEGTRGLLVPFADPEALAAAILECLRSPEAARERTLRGRAEVVKRHAVERLVTDVDALYRELLGGRAATA